MQHSAARFTSTTRWLLTSCTKRTPKYTLCVSSSTARLNSSWTRCLYALWRSVMWAARSSTSAHKAKANHHDVSVRGSGL